MDHWREEKNVNRFFIYSFFLFSVVPLYKNYKHFYYSCLLFPMSVLLYSLECFYEYIHYSNNFINSYLIELHYFNFFNSTVVIEIIR